MGIGGVIVILLIVAFALSFRKKNVIGTVTGMNRRCPECGRVI
ncbi:unnamed protein product, partial [marine sediment metagenome]